MPKTISKRRSLAAAQNGRMGGLAKVPKGFAMATPEQRSAAGRKGMASRWGKKQRAK